MKIRSKFLNNKTKKKIEDGFFWFVIIIPYLLLVFSFIWYRGELDEVTNAKFILIDKNSFKLNLYSYEGKLLSSYDVSFGKNYGNKSERGDNKTPEGIFNVISIENSSSWDYDFEGDTLGPIVGAYGPYFIRLDVPSFRGIGIHGTHDNSTIGRNVSHGCIRMRNEELLELVEKIQTGVVVVITPSIYDVIADSIDSDIVKKIFYGESY